MRLLNLDFGRACMTETDNHYGMAPDTRASRASVRVGEMVPKRTSVRWPVAGEPRSVLRRQK